jgi:tRNA-dihydrouridine synthase
MADVTDPAWRALVAKHGKPDVFWTEFVSADGLYHTLTSAKVEDDSSSIGLAAGALESSATLRASIHNPLLRDLQFSKEEHPIVAQIFSDKPGMIAFAAKLVEDLGFDGVDINMGCPDRAIEKQGAGASLMKKPELAVELIKAAKAATSLPVSIKTRIGYAHDSLDTWLPLLIEAEPAAITLHLRTRKEMSLVPAHWDLMPKAVAIRDALGSNIPLIGNGDVTDRQDGDLKIRESGCDGVMIGRGMFGNPWVFAGRKSADTPLREKLAALIELAYAYEALTPPKHFAILKKHIKAFVTGFDGAAELRHELMEATDAHALEAILRATAVAKRA